MNSANNQLERAIQLAVEYHAGQVDKNGQPYILHPLAVMGYVRSDRTKTIAVLHDIIEDTHLELHDLIAMGFEEVIVEAIDALTHREHESRADYYGRIKHNPEALEVKFADIRHNTLDERLNALDLETRVRLIMKYEEATKILTGATDA
jgi:(p)ppGpp synthase/HD superfamily hydrolase